MEVAKFARVYNEFLEQRFTSCWVWGLGLSVA